MRFEFNDDSQKICNSVDVVNYGIQCDICGNKVLSVSNINGKRYCAGCYYKTFMKDNQKAEIDQLKQQLADKQNTIDEINKEFVQAVHDWKVLCAEKDKEIEDCKRNELYEENMKILAVKNQTQLALQELEKVKEYIQKHKYKTLKEDRHIVYYKSLKDQIDNQIKVLKGE